MVAVGGVHHDAQHHVLQILPLLRGQDLHGLGQVFLLAGEQFIHAHAQKLRQSGQQADIRAGLVVLPFADRLGAHIQFICQVFLLETFLPPQHCDALAKCHFHK